MTIYDPAPRDGWWTAPRRGCAASLLLAAILAALPHYTTERIKSAIGTLLRPGLLAATAAGQRFDALVVGVHGVFSTTAERVRVGQELDALRIRNRQLKAAVQALAATNTAAAEPPHAPLLSPQLIECRILGRQAQAFLQPGALLDVGLAASVRVDSLVIDVPAVVDCGAPAGVEAGSLVLAGSRVWGKVQQVGQQISHIRRAHEAGYRDLVRIGRSSQPATVSGPRGVLEGTGASLCRIRLVPVTEAVSIGDPVFSEGGEGLLPYPLHYGEVVRVERPAGATHWEIWMRPALDGTPTRVAVLSATGSMVSNVDVND